MNFTEAMRLLDEPNDLAGPTILGQIVCAIAYSREWARTLAWFEANIIPRINISTDYPLLEIIVAGLRLQVPETETTEMIRVCEAIGDRIIFVIDEVIAEHRAEERQRELENAMFIQFLSEEYRLPRADVSGWF